MDKTLTKALQAEFHRTNKACDDMQVKVTALQAQAAPIHEQIAARKAQLVPIAAAIQVIAKDLHPLAKERTRIVQVLDGKTGSKPG